MSLNFDTTPSSALASLANLLPVAPSEPADSIPLVQFSLSKDGIIIQFHGRAFARIGLTQENAVGLSIFECNNIFVPIYGAVRRALKGERSTTTLIVEGGEFQVWLAPIANSRGTSGIGVTAIDVSEQRAVELAHRTREQSYRLLAEHSTDIITKYNDQGICTFASPSAKRVLGYEPHEIIGTSVFDLFHPEDIKAKRKLFAKFLDENADSSVCYRIRHSDGRYVWLETSSDAVHAITGEIVEIIAVSRDITERKETEERLLYLANYDSLTGLPNRALFRDRLRRAITRAQRNDKRIGLLFLDLDRFKTINDSLGHHAGDQLLRGVAKRLIANGRKGDTIARLGGDEFTIILEDIQDADDAAIVARKILEFMEPAFKLDGHEVVISPSIGITIFPDDCGDMRTLLKNADTAMYRSKEKGRNNYQFYTADMNAKAYEYLLLENNLRHALERGEFRLFYQPQMDLQTQRVIGMEALLRWEHPEQGLLPPEQFIPFAEETGLIIPIGEWVLRTACMEAMRWQQAGLAPLRVAVNLSMCQFRQKDFVEKIEQALIDSGLRSTLLELEITESFLAHNVEQATAVLRRLHDIGVQLSIDDFGTGYSSLSYLKQFPLNTLKIDQSFVRDIPSDPDGAAIAEAIIGLGQALRLNVIAEGVESQDQVFFLRARGCDHAQGYLFGQPMPADTIIPWLKRKTAHQSAFEQWPLWQEQLPHAASG